MEGNGSESRVMLTVERCQCCRMRHEVELRPYHQHQVGAYSHWYQCPETSDPVPVSVVPYEGEPVGIDAQLSEYMARCQRAGRFMAACWRLEDGVIHLDQRCEDWPIADMPESLLMLGKQIAVEQPQFWGDFVARLREEGVIDEGGECAVPTLPTVELPEPRYNLWGRDGEECDE